MRSLRTVAHAVHGKRLIQPYHVIRLPEWSGPLCQGCQNQIQVSAGFQPFVGVPGYGACINSFKPAFHFGVIRKIMQYSDIPKAFEHILSRQLDRADKAHADKDDTLIGRAVKRASLRDIKDAPLLNIIAVAIHLKTGGTGTDIANQRIRHAAFMINPVIRKAVPVDV